MFDGLKDMGKLLKQAKEMKSQMKKVQDQLKKLTVEGRGASGKIVVVLTGELEVVDVNIDPELLDKTYHKAFQKEMKKAITEATQKAKNMATEKLSAVSGDLNLPGMG